MFKLLLYAAAIYFAIRLGRLLLMPKSPVKKKRKVYDEEDVRDAEYTDIEEDHE